MTLKTNKNEHRFGGVLLLFTESSNRLFFDARNGGEDCGDKSIKGITVEIDGDTTGLSKALSSVNKEMKSTHLRCRFGRC